MKTREHNLKSSAPNQHSLLVGKDDFAYWLYCPQFKRIHFKPSCGSDPSVMHQLFTNVKYI